jgi:hypothetical protein
LATLGSDLPCACPADLLVLSKGGKDSTLGTPATRTSAFVPQPSLGPSTCPLGKGSRAQEETGHQRVPPSRCTKGSQVKLEWVAPKLSPSLEPCRLSELDGSTPGFQVCSLLYWLCDVGQNTLTSPGQFSHLAS